MRILQLSLHPPFDPAAVVSGAQLREAGIRRVLQQGGYQVDTLALAGEGTGKPAGTGQLSAQQLALRLQQEPPDVLLVGYWSLLAALPSFTGPVILDFIAPRLLEAMFQEPGRLQHEARELLALLPRADHFLVGNQRQADLLLSLLLLAGIDCRERAPIAIVPIATSAEVPAWQAPLGEIRLVSAGVEWPWRQTTEYHAELGAWCAQNSGFVFQRLAGAFPGTSGEGGGALLPYAELQRQLSACHIGLELSRRNTEREFSHSFRLLDYLQCGLPVLVNPWLPLAPLIRDYNAGWLVETPQDLPGVLEEIRQHPAVLDAKAAGARRLVAEVLNYPAACAPLLHYLARPWRPVKDRTALSAALGAQQVQLQPSRFWRLQAALVQGYQLLFCRRRPAVTPDILLVTRSDLFPVNHGAAVKIVRTAEALSRLGRRVWLCTDERRRYYCFENGNMRTERFPWWLPLLALPRRLALLRLLLRGYPWSNAFLYFPLADCSYLVRSLYLATRYPVGAWLAEFPAYVQPLRYVRKLFGGRLLLVEHNVEYERLREQIATLSEGSYQQLKDQELRLCQSADAVVTVSDNDRALLLRDGVDPRKLHTIPHGVDLAGFRQAQVEDVRSHYGIAAEALLLVYHGPYNYAPNLQAITVLVQELLPLLQARGLQVKVLAIGSKPPATLQHPDLIFTGPLPDLTTVLPAADLAVIPLREGGGTRMKILDYFAAGVSVISTAKGIEGIPVTHGVEALIIDDVDAMAAAVMELAAQPEQRRALAGRAALFVEDLSWDAIAARYLPLLDGS
jgi:glycosyltransferase involved in cell wall biosynthesis